MSDDNKKNNSNALAFIIPIVGAALIGMLFLGMQESQKHAQARISNLPALEAQIKFLSQSQVRNMDDISVVEHEIGDMQKEIAKSPKIESLAGRFDLIRDKIDSIEQQFSRSLDREISQPNNQRVSALESRVLYLEKRVTEMSNSINTGAEFYGIHYKTQ